MTKQRVLIGVAMLAVIGGGLWWWRHRSDDDPATSTVTQTSGSGGARATRAPAVDPARIVVSVRDAKGPIAGALVRLAPKDGEVVLLHAAADGVATSGAL